MSHVVLDSLKSLTCRVLLSCSPASSGSQIHASATRGIHGVQREQCAGIILCPCHLVLAAASPSRATSGTSHSSCYFSCRQATIYLALSSFAMLGTASHESCWHFASFSLNRLCGVEELLYHRKRLCCICCDHLILSHMHAFDTQLERLHVIQLHEVRWV
jgi:hypothetical protein